MELNWEMGSSKKKKKNKNCRRTTATVTNKAETTLAFLNLNRSTK